MLQAKEIVCSHNDIKVSPWRTVLLNEVIFAQVVKFVVFYRNGNFITVFTRTTARPYLESDESSPHVLLS
jgi:hypothetical protein